MHKWYINVGKTVTFFGGTGGPSLAGALCHGTFGTMVNPALLDQHHIGYFSV